MRKHTSRSIRATTQTMTRQDVWQRDGIVVSAQISSSGEAGRRILQKLKTRLEDLVTDFGFATLLCRYQQELNPVQIGVADGMMECPICERGYLAANLAGSSAVLQVVTWNDVIGSVEYDAQAIWPDEEAPIESLVCPNCNAEIAFERCRFVPAEPEPDLECLECHHRFSAYADWIPDLACPACGSPDIGKVQSAGSTPA